MHKTAQPTTPPDLDNPPPGTEHTKTHEKRPATPAPPREKDLDGQPLAVAVQEKLSTLKAAAAAEQDGTKEKQAAEERLSAFESLVSQWQTNPHNAEARKNLLAQL